MSIIPISFLSSSDLSLLGNNIKSTPRPRRPHPELAPINRSLAPHGERVTKLYRCPNAVIKRSR
jgi:hypothetical protein